MFLFFLFVLQSVFCSEGFEGDGAWVREAAQAKLHAMEIAAKTCGSKVTVLHRDVEGVVKRCVWDISAYVGKDGRPLLDFLHGCALQGTFRGPHRLCERHYSFENASLTFDVVQECLVRDLRAKYRVSRVPFSPMIKGESVCLNATRYWSFMEKKCLINWFEKESIVLSFSDVALVGSEIGDPGPSVEWRQESNYLYALRGAQMPIIVWVSRYKTAPQLEGAKLREEVCAAAQSKLNELETAAQTYGSKVTVVCSDCIGDVRRCVWDISAYVCQDGRTLLDFLHTCALQGTFRRPSGVGEDHYGFENVSLTSDVVRGCLVSDILIGKRVSSVPFSPMIKGDNVWFYSLVWRCVKQKNLKDLSFKNSISLSFSGVALFGMGGRSFDDWRTDTNYLCALRGAQTPTVVWVTPIATDGLLVRGAAQGKLRAMEIAAQTHGSKVTVAHRDGSGVVKRCVWDISPYVGEDGCTLLDFLHRCVLQGTFRMPGYDIRETSYFFANVSLTSHVVNDCLIPDLLSGERVSKDLFSPMIDGKKVRSSSLSWRFVEQKELKGWGISGLISLSFSGVALLGTNAYPPENWSTENNYLFALRGGQAPTWVSKPIPAPEKHRLSHFFRKHQSAVQPADDEKKCAGAQIRLHPTQMIKTTAV